MHLPGPVRAAVGLVASASTELRKLPDRAIELPMLAVSTALQMSLRAQQRYAQLAAKGDEVLSRGPAGDEPPPWARFDEPVPAEELHRSALAQLDTLLDDSDDAEAGSVGRMFEQLFGVDDPADLPGPDRRGADGAAADDGPTATVTPISDAERTTRPARKATPRTATARKAAPRKAASTEAASPEAASPEAPTDDTPADAPAKAPAKKASRKTAKKASRKSAARPRTTPATDKPSTDKPSTDKPADDNGVADAVKSEPETAPPTQAPDDTPARGKSVSPPRDRAPSRFDAAGDDDSSD